MVLTWFLWSPSEFRKTVRKQPPHGQSLPVSKFQPDRIRNVGGDVSEKNPSETRRNNKNNKDYEQQQDVCRYADIVIC